MIFQDVLAMALDPGTFDCTLPKTDAMYYVARMCHEISMNIYAVAQKDFQYRQDTVSGVAAIDTMLETYAASFESWAVSAVSACEGGLPIPSPPTFPSLPNDQPFPQWMLVLFIKCAIKLIVSWLHKKLDPDTDALEISRILKAALLSGEGEDQYSLLEALAGKPLTICIKNSSGDFQELSFQNP